MNYCLDCKKEIHQKSIRCKSCAKKGKLNVTFKGKYFCKICHKEISYGHLYCKNHYGILISQKCIGKKFSEEHKKKISESHRGKIGFWKNKKRPELLGKNNGNWRGGTENLPYSIEWTETFKESIRKRDNYDCQNCGMTEEEHLIIYGTVLHIHHIDYNKQNCAKDNLITLCTKCNSKANFNRDYWKNFFENKLIIIQKEIIPNG
jgi:hypothetical protein